MLTDSESYHAYASIVSYPERSTARCELNLLDGSCHPRWSVWLNEMQRSASYNGVYGGARLSYGCMVTFNHNLTLMRCGQVFVPLPLVAHALHYLIGVLFLASETRGYEHGIASNVT